MTNININDLINLKKLERVARQWVLAFNEVILERRNKKYIHFLELHFIWSNYTIINITYSND